MNGYNPILWNCKNSGCFNKKKRPKIEQFHNCFFDKISMSDIDAAVEINGNFIFLEWKSDGGKLKVAQRIFFERLTRHKGIFVYVVQGNAESMQVDGYWEISNGVMNPQFTPCDLDELKKIFKSFNDWAVRNPQK
jgi:hypothetical protein